MVIRCRDDDGRCDAMRCGVMLGVDKYVLALLINQRATGRRVPEPESESDGRPGQNKVWVITASGGRCGGMVEKCMKRVWCLCGLRGSKSWN